jgi:hypothetical protein
MRRQNSSSRSRRFSGSLPAIRLALMAPIDVPMIQSGSPPLLRLLRFGLHPLALDRPSTREIQHVFLPGCARQRRSR